MPVERAERAELLKRIHLFRGFDDEVIEQIAELLEPVDIDDPRVIFRRDDDPDYFYFVYTGKVWISRWIERTRTWKRMGPLESGDYFGQEVLHTNWPRQVNAEADAETVLLRLSIRDFIHVLEIVPALGQRLQMILDSYRLMLRMNFNWLEENEIVYYVARKHLLFLILKLLPPLILGGIAIPVLLYASLTTLGVTGVLGLTAPFLFVLAVIFFLGWLAWAYVDWSNDYYVATKTRVIYQERVVLLYDSRLEAPLEAVQSISINTSQVGRILGYGNVIVRTYFGVILFKNVFAPEHVMGLLQDRQYFAQVYQRREELQDITKRLNERIEKGPQLPKPPGGRPPKPATQTSKMQQFLATLLHQRYEAGGAIIYRTHWIILLKKTGLPLLMLLGLSVLFIISVYNQFVLLAFQTTCALSFLVGIILFTWLAYQYLDWHNDIYIITQDQVVDVNKKPLGHEERRAAQLNKIQNVEYQRLGIIGLLFNFGTVYIQVGDIRLTFDEVWQPADVQRQIFRSLNRRNQLDREAQMENDRQRLADWIAIYHESRGYRPPPQAPSTGRRGGF